MRSLYLLLTTLWLAPLVSAQQFKASAELHARQVGGQVQAAVQIEVDSGWYLYHTELGDKNAIGMPLEFVWSGPELDWSEAILPDPSVGKVDDEWIGKYSYNYHKGTVTAWFQAEGTPDLGALRLDIKGQTCSEKDGTCILFAPKGLKPSQAHPPGMWANAPAAFQVIAGGASGVKPSDGAAGSQAVSDPFAVTPKEGENKFGWVPDYGGDNIDARLRVVTDGEQVIARFEFDVLSGHHAYHGPTLDDIANEPVPAQATVVELSGDDVEWGEPVFAAPHIEMGDNMAFTKKVPIKTHEGTWTVQFEGSLEPGTELEEIVGTAKGQVCDDRGCVQFDIELDAEIFKVASLGGEVRAVPTPGGDAAEGAGDTANGSTTKQEDSQEDPEKGGASLLAFLGQAVFWGFFTLLMPCTYPMIPITISFFTKQATQRGGKVLPLALAYGAGIILIFIVIGLVAAPVIVPFATHPITNLIIGLLFLFFALTLFGVINLQPPAFMNRMAGQASMKGGYLGVFLMGATLVVTSFTCTAPFVGTLLASGAAGGGATSEGILRIVLGMGTFGLVMATPFVILSLVPGRLQALPQAGGWMNTLKVYMGFVEVAAALKFFSNADVFWNLEILNNQVFLLASILIFVLAAIYLIVQNRKSGSHSALQYGVALLTLTFAGFLATYLNGRPAGDIMSAILPGYHSEPLVKAFGDKRHYTRHKNRERRLGGSV